MTRFLPEDNLSYPVLIRIGSSGGSGFYFIHQDKVVYLVTAKHVLYDVTQKPNVLKANHLKVLSYDRDQKLSDPMETVVDLAVAVIHTDSSRDVALVKLADVIEVEGQKVMKYSPGVSQGASRPSTIVAVTNAHLKQFEQVMTSNEVIILGFPNSLSFPMVPQIEYNRPLLRKGIVAGKNYQNKTIILDCPVYQGNSGGVAIEVEEMGLGKRNFKVIGVVIQYIPFVEQMKSLQFGYTNSSYENSGYSVVEPVDTILNLIEPVSIVAKVDDSQSV